MLDKIDFKILDALKQDSKVSMREISRKIGVAASTVHDRIRALKKERVIKRYTGDIDNDKIGKSLTAYMLLSFDSGEIQKHNITDHKVTDDLAKHPAIEEVCSITGRSDLFIKVNVKDMKELDEVTVKFIRQAIGVSRTETMVVMYRGK